MSGSFIDQVIQYLIAFPFIIISLTFHEFSHAWVAYQLGDTTAKENGRLTLNPLAHLDPIGFLFMIFARIGWAKPVPVDTENFKKPRQGLFLVAAAGPISNFFLASVGVLFLKICSIIWPILPDFLLIPSFTFIMVNISLGLFNLMPIPPFDGGNLVSAFLPEDMRDTWDSIKTLMPVVLLFLIIPGSPFFAIFNMFWYNILDIISNVILRIIGM